MAMYDIGSKSLIFKRISMFLQETYMSTLEVSDEYTLDLAKCIYEYLRDFYPNTYQYWLPVMSQPSDFTKVLQDKIKNDVETMTGFEVISVNVKIQGIENNRNEEKTEIVKEEEE